MRKATIAFVLDHLGRIVDWECDTANVYEGTAFQHLADKFDEEMVIFSDTGFEKKEWHPTNLRLCQCGEWNVQMRIETETVAAIRDLAAQTSGIPPAQIYLAATHTHAGPQVVHTFISIDEIDACYLELLTRQVASAVMIAAERAREARIGFGRGQEPSLVFNRRLVGTDGHVLMNFNTPKAQAQELGLHPLGPVDPTVDLIRVDSEDGKPMAVFVNYGLHNAAVGGDFASAGFPATMRSLLCNALGDVAVLFSEGPCGNQPY